MKHLIFLFFYSSFLFALDSTSFNLVNKTNRTVRVPNVSRVAVANSKILKVKALSSSSLLFTALGVGKTTVRVWNASGTESEYVVRVVSPKLDNNLGSTDRGTVVKVALEFLELDFAFGKTLGIQWPDSIQFSGIGQLASSSSTTGLNYEATFGSAKGWIRHLQKEGWAKILANPELYVRLGEQAVFHSGGELPIATSSPSFGGVSHKIEWKKFGITAKVRPESVDLIHMSGDIDLEISEPDMARAIENIPAISKRNLLTKINSLDGETVILSGLVKRETSHEKNSVPLLGSIPLIGALFSSNSDADNETELLMAVTFSVSTKSREGEKIKKFKDKFHAERE